MPTDIHALEQRVEEARRNMFCVLTAGQMHMRMGELIAAVEALATERERAKCRADECEHCAADEPVAFTSESHIPCHADDMGAYLCGAANIHQRAIRERGEAQEEKP